ncbi:hypothetical protein [Streptomyces sp. NPDC059788]|uniref:hypothetical protein n=1 Tax=Streptomyces sp. NPDC059788 TaxID=3346948 RepID=UPI0036635638
MHAVSCRETSYAISPETADHGFDEALRERTVDIGQGMFDRCDVEGGELPVRR